MKSILLYTLFFLQNYIYNNFILGCLILKWMSRIIFNQKNVESNMRIMHLSLVLVNVGDKIVVVLTLCYC